MCFYFIRISNRTSTTTYMDRCFLFLNYRNPKTFCASDLSEISDGNGWQINAVSLDDPENDPATELHGTILK